jgi:hypothetical protein
VLGFYLRMEDMSSPRSEIEWTDLFTGPLRTHHLAERGVRAELISASEEPYQWGRDGERPLSLSALLVWPHRGISQFRCGSLCKGDSL